MKNYTITVNGNVYDVVVEETAAGQAPVAPKAPAAPKAPQAAAAPKAAAALRHAAAQARKELYLNAYPNTKLQYRRGA